jgi:hypothetical protein
VALEMVVAPAASIEPPSVAPEHLIVPKPLLVAMTKPPLLVAWMPPV